MAEKAKMNIEHLGGVARLREENEKVVKDCESRIQHWQKVAGDYEALNERLKTLPDQLSYDIMVPFGPLAFMPGKLVHTNEVTALLGDNWFAKCSAKQAQKVVDHRMKYVKHELDDLTKTMKNFEARVGLAKDLETISSSKGDYVDIREETGNNDAAVTKGKQRIARKPNSMPKMDAVLDLKEENEGESGDGGSRNGTLTEEELWARLDELEKLEELQDEQDRLSDNADMNGEDTSSISSEEEKEGDAAPPVNGLSLKPSWTSRPHSKAPPSADRKAAFIFAWVLMAIVTTLFVVGGNVKKLICEPLANRQLFKIIDTPFLVHPAKKNFLPGMLFQNPNIDLTLGSLYRDCHENNGLYHSLQLETMFNINSFLNRTVYNKDLAKVFESVQVDLQDIMLLEQAGRDNLINFANSGVGEIDYEAYLAEVNKGVTLVDLLSFSTDLEAQADQLPRGALENALKGHASSIRQIHREQVVPMLQAMSTLSQSIKQLQRMSNNLPVKVTNILSAIDAAEYLITHNASHVVKRETKGYIQSLEGYFKQYREWVKNSLTAEVAQCKPISNIVDSMEIVACSFIVDSVNTFWFGLGGCCILLIPSIIFSVKLAKYYRRMDTEDVFEDSPYYDTLTRFPRASAPPSYSDW